NHRNHIGLFELARQQPQPRSNLGGLLMAQNPRSDERNSAQERNSAPEVAREAARRGAEQAERIVRTTADMNSQAARTGSDLMEPNVKPAHQVLQSGAEMAARIAERSANNFNRAYGLTGEEARRAAQSSTGSLAALLRASAVMAELTQDMALEWMHFSRDR